MELRGQNMKETEKGRHFRRDETMMDTAVGEMQGAGDVVD